MIVSVLCNVFSECKLYDVFLEHKNCIKVILGKMRTLNGSYVKNENTRLCDRCSYYFLDLF